jgi:hypothetical protein
MKSLVHLPYSVRFPKLDTKNKVHIPALATRCLLQMLVFWVVTPCRLMGRYQCFRGTYCFHLQNWSQHEQLYCRDNLKSHRKSDCPVARHYTVIQRVLGSIPSDIPILIFLLNYWSLRLCQWYNFGDMKKQAPPPILVWNPCWWKCRWVRLRLWTATTTRPMFKVVSTKTYL